MVETGANFDISVYSSLGLEKKKLINRELRGLMEEFTIEIKEVVKNYQYSIKEYCNFQYTKCNKACGDNCKCKNKEKNEKERKIDNCITR